MSVDSSLDGKLVRCKGFQRKSKHANTKKRKHEDSAEVGTERSTRSQIYKHPRTEVRGRFGAPHARRPCGLLRGVLGRDPLVPVLIHSVFVVSGPQIGPEPHRLGRGSSAFDHDAERCRLGGQRKTGHGLAPHARGNDLLAPVRSTVRAAGNDSVTGISTRCCGDVIGCACRLDSGD
jgi:hypothetical protein